MLPKELKITPTITFSSFGIERICYDRGLFLKEGLSVKKSKLYFIYEKAFVTCICVPSFVIYDYFSIK